MIKSIENYLTHLLLHAPQKVHTVHGFFSETDVPHVVHDFKWLRLNGHCVKRNEILAPNRLFGLQFYTFFFFFLMKTFTSFSIVFWNSCIIHGACLHAVGKHKPTNVPKFGTYHKKHPNPQTGGNILFQALGYLY